MAKSPPPVPDVWLPITGNTPLVANNKYLVDTSAACTLTLPSLASTRIGASITLLDFKGLAATNNITLSPSGSDAIINVSGSLLIDINGVVLLVICTSLGWKFTALHV